jgi:hypothetical protein
MTLLLGKLSAEIKPQIITTVTHKRKKHTSKPRTVDAFPRTKSTSELKLNSYQLPSSFNSALEKPQSYRLLSFGKLNVVDGPVCMLFQD